MCAVFIQWVRPDLILLTLPRPVAARIDEQGLGPATVVEEILCPTALMGLQASFRSTEWKEHK
jgi:hypothetical protein